jgi:hypothetical protein
MGVERQEIEVLLRIMKGDANLQISLAVCHIPRLIELAERHKVVYQLLLFARQHKTYFSPEQIAQLENLCRQGAQRSLTQLHQLKKIACTLNENGIGYVCIKGPQLSRMIYGREALKESLDIDILLAHEKDLMRVHELLSGMGYTQSNLNQYNSKIARKIFLIAKREVSYFNRETRCAIDLHIRPGANTYLTARYFKEFLSDLKTDDLEGTPVPVLPDEAYFAYLCYHGALHQFSRIAWLIDIRAFLLIKRNDFDYPKLMAIGRSLHAERSIILAMLLLQHYFGDEIPGHILTGINYSKRFRYLVSTCRNYLGRDPNFRMTLLGKIEKVVYIMLLIQGVEGKIDWLYGIFMRQVIKFLAKPPRRKVY